MRELIDRIVPERPRLENGPLKTVVCQAQFPSQLSLSDDEVRPIQRALSHRYPLAAAEPAGGAQRGVLRFGDSDGGWVVTVTPEAISLETTAYIGMRDLLIRWSELAAVAAEAFELTVQTRLGLRYINELEFPDPRKEDLTGWVRQELLIPYFAPSQDDDLLRFVSHAQFRQPDGSSCNMRHGIAPGESEEGRLFFLLDLDCFVGDIAEFDPAGQIRSLAKLNESAYGFFTWAFSDRTFESFGPEGRARTGEWVVKSRETRSHVLHHLVSESAWSDYTATAHEYLHRGRQFEPAVDRFDTVPVRFDDRLALAPEPEPLSAVLESIRESIDIPVVDLARMVGLRRRHFYNLLDGSPTSTETEARVRRLAVALERLAAATGGGPQVLRSAVLTPVGADALSLFEIAVAGDDKRLTATVEALVVQIETRGARRTRRAIPRPVSPSVAKQRRRLMRESLADRPPQEPERKGRGE